MRWAPAARRRLRMPARCHRLPVTRLGLGVLGEGGLPVDAVRVDLQEDRDAVPDTAGHLGRGQPRSPAAAAADSKTNVRAAPVRRSRTVSLRRTR
jgi:hypothetical protein